MNVLVIGRGGREHAICSSLANSASVTNVFCAPGNAGIAAVAKRVNIEETDQESIIQFAKENDIKLTIVGPEQPLSEGITDRFLAENLKIFGPTKEAALIEGSKSFAKDLMKKYDVPTGAYETFQDADLAKEYIKKQGAPIVIKADGLAAGKGVVVAETLEEAEKAVENMLIEGQFGSSSRQIVIEEFLDGEEFSLMALVHNQDIIPLEIAQDHKRAFDGDKGPNTGGMGAYSPVPHLPASIAEEALSTILEPVAEAMIKEAKPFTGVLYAGLILTANGPKVIEFNARFGDPETQVVLPRLETDLAELLLSLLNGEKIAPKWNPEAKVGVVAAAEGYPGEYKKGISLDSFHGKNDRVFHSGTEEDNGRLYSAGGRVLLVLGSGDSVKSAQENAYSFLDEKVTDGLFYRKDIAYKAVKKG
ncbi:phosphoribosylamine--glycine ligase [Jeotgalibacillus proteolyticus]|uniref:Phosphoribosylamine--glycine ligase n=1 Tax=Jeotgalibacillus proteolyticus TaxID=2082395 RepID=A0A2S5G7R1_9BACL|nr:phosphoribosylamine--glycine ligase [Jeotgalibacillus proteolyticus]PPA68983.1 phosphoribosylamine--glycine ligase [Jeotgalibacillus proteolyticus]